MKKLLGLAALAGVSIAGVGVANAEGTVSASVAMTSDYVFRGLSQTDGGAAIQGSFDYSNGIFYAGVWGSNVNFGATDFTETASLELDAYVGITPTTGPVSWDLALVGYFYPNADDEVGLTGGDLDYYEAVVGASMNLTEPLTIGAQIAYSPDFFAETGDALYYEINGAYAFSETFSLSAAYGNQDVDDYADSYDTWNFGGTFATHGFDLDLRYIDTSDAFESGYASESNSDGRVVFTVARSL